VGVDPGLNSKAFILEYYRYGTSLRPWRALERYNNNPLSTGLTLAIPVGKVI
jgi:hypothetical protein